MERKWRVLIVVCVAVFMLLLDITVVNVALPNIDKELNTSFTDLQWVVDAYALTLAATMLNAGSLGDLLGRKRVFLVAIALFTLASALCGAAHVAALADPRARRAGDRRRRRCSRSRSRSSRRSSTAASAAPPSGSGARRSGWPWRSGRSSAARSRPTSAGAGSSSSTSRSGSPVSRRAFAYCTRRATRRPAASTWRACSR